MGLEEIFEKLEDVYYFVGSGFVAIEAFRRHKWGKWKGFNSTFNSEDKKILEENKVYPYFANKFAGKINPKKIVEYFNTEKTDSKFDNYIRVMAPYEYMSKLLNHFSVEDANRLSLGKNTSGFLSVNPDFAIKLKNRFPIEGIIELYSSVAREGAYFFEDPEFEEIFSYFEKDRDIFIDKICNLILSYDHRFTYESISQYIEQETHPTKVNTYNDTYNELEIKVIQDLRLDPKNPLHKEKSELIKLAIKHVGINEHDYTFKKFHAAGNEGIIIADDFFFDDNKPAKAYKVGYDLKNEFELLRKIHSEQPNSKRIMKYSEPLRSEQKIDILPLEFVRTLPLFTDGLEDYEIYKNLYELVEGVYELRLSSVYHNDLHENNVLRKKDKSLIITDFNSATLTPENEKALNRKYSNNDLIAAGLLGYKLKMGHNLFNESNGQSNLSMMKNQIQSERIKTYADRDALTAKFEEIEENVEGPIANSIIYLLDRDLYKQPELPEVEKALKQMESYI